MRVHSNESCSGEHRMYLFDCLQATAGLQEMIIEAMAIRGGGGGASEACV